MDDHDDGDRPRAVGSSGSVTKVLVAVLFLARDGTDPTKKRTPIRKTP